MNVALVVLEMPDMTLTVLLSGFGFQCHVSHDVLCSAMCQISNNTLFELEFHPDIETEDIWSLKMKL